MDDYYEFEQDLIINATKSDVKTLNALEVINASNIIMFLNGTFHSNEIVTALGMRSTDKYLRYQNTIYTPTYSNFSLSGLNLDEAIMVDKIYRYAQEKTRQRINLF